MSVVTVVRSRVEADVIVGMLHSHGIRAWAASDDMAGLNLAMQQSQGVRVHVAEQQADEARRLLEAARPAPPGPPEPARAEPARAEPARPNALRRWLVRLLGGGKPGR